MMFTNKHTNKPNIKCKKNIYARFVKRLMDVILSLCALIILSPLMILMAVLIRITLGKPVVFMQIRPGKDEKLFKFIKFRTMSDKKDAEGKLLPDSQRITKFGKILRATSIDELPELINIVKGDMSIVGPRPQLVKDMQFMTDEQRQRHKVLPGLTGWAQVNGRNSISWERKLELDIEYIENITFWQDCKIILLTILKVVKRDGICSEGMETSEDYGDYLLRLEKISIDNYIQVLDKIQL